MNLAIFLYILSILIHNLQNFDTLLIMQEIYWLLFGTFVWQLRSKTVSWVLVSMDKSSETQIQLWPCGHSRGIGFCVVFWAKEYAIVFISYAPIKAPIMNIAIDIVLTFVIFFDCILFIIFIRILIYNKNRCNLKNNDNFCFYLYRIYHILRKVFSYVILLYQMVRSPFRQIFEIEKE